MKRKFLYLVVVMVSLALGIAHAVQDESLERKYVGGIYFAGGQWCNAPIPIGSPGDTLYSFTTPGTRPGGLAWDGEYFWNCDTDSTTLYKLTPTGSVDTSFSLLFAGESLVGGGLEWDGSYLWKVFEETAKLYKIDPVTGLPLTSFSLPDSASFDPNCWGLAWDGTYLWCSRYATSPRIYKLDPSNGEVLYSFAPPNQFILGIAWDGTHLCGVDIWSMTLYKMNPSDSSVVDSIPWQVPYPLGLLWDGSHLWNVSGAIANCGNQRVYKVDAGTGIIEDNNHTSDPQHRWLSQNRPNPFNSNTSIYYFCPKHMHLELVVYNIKGELVRTLLRGKVSAGSHDISWDGRDSEGGSVSSGIYFYQLKAAGGIKETRKMLILR